MIRDVKLKVTKFIKKHDNIFCLTLIFLSIYGITLNVNINNSDELWNFQNVYKMYNGYLIYKDVNVITTPLFFLIGEMIFKILGANFFTFRIYNMLIITTFFFITYLLLKELKISKKLAIIVVLFFILYKGYYIVLGQANYNVMAILFCILGILTNIRKSKHNAIKQGIILFLIFITKQNVGLLYAMALFISQLLEKKEKKEKIKNITIEIFTCFCLGMILLIYFCNNNILNSFINLAVFGVKEFSKENIHIEISNFLIIIFFIFINIYMTRIFIKGNKVNGKEKERLMILNTFSIFLSFITFPILNEMHFFLGIYMLVILFIYQVLIFLRKIEVNLNEKLLKIVLSILVIFSISNSTYNFVSWLKAVKSENYNIKPTSPFYGGFISDEELKSIGNVVKYMESKSNNVVVLSNKAAFYMILTNRNNGILDLPFRGNLGKEGEKGLVETIKKLNNTEILIEKSEEEMNWQESMMARQYIKNNKQKIGEIEEFEIYY